MRGYAAAAAAVACSVLLCVAPAYAAYRGTNGRIAFGRVSGTGRLDVKTVKADGTGMRVLKKNASDPDWSPGGTKIAITRQHKDGAPGPGCSIQISRPDGTVIRDLGGSAKGCNFGPTFTPNGREIVFVYDDAMGHQELRSMNVHGGNRNRIRSIPSGLEAHEPRVSPDGRTIALQMQQAGSDTRRALFTLKMNGKRLRQLTPFTMNVGTVVDWAPNGDHIVFTEYRSGPGNTMLIRPDGTGRTHVTHYGGHVGAGGASYAPNGKWIVYRRQNSATGRNAIWKMRPDGTNRTHIRAIGSGFGGLDWGGKSA